jgi:hypothetical protein
MTSRIKIPTFIKILLVINLILGLAYIINYLIGWWFPKLTSFVDLNGEDNLPTWYSSIQWFCVATVLGIFAWRNFSPSSWRSWLLLALPLMFLAFSLDEVAQIHEWFGFKTDRFLPGRTRLHTMFQETGIWAFLVGPPFIALFGSVMFSLRTYFKHAPDAFVKILLGMMVMLTGALGLETLSNFIDIKSEFYILEIVMEEFLEMTGSTIILWGSCELLQRQGFAIQFDKTGLSVNTTKSVK